MLSSLRNNAFGKIMPFAAGVACFIFTGSVACFVLFCAPAVAHAQGCAQCLDSTRATPPGVQAAYRHAIYLLGGCAATLFCTGLLFLKKNH